MANDRLINSTQGESIIAGLNTIAAKLDGLKPISVADNGKVVIDGELVSQTAYPTTVTENDTYDTTNYNSITINVSGGGSSGNVVIFYDYDGSVIASYSAADFANLSAMPANPTHEGLTAQGWNWTLADAKAYVANYGNLNIGQMYITSDGKTRLYYIIPKDSLTLNLYLALDEDTELDVDWGDGSEHTTWTSNDGDSSKSHEYSDGGRYTVAITVTDGGFSCKTSGDDDYTLKKVEFGSSVTSISEYAFNNCHELSSITIPDSVTSIGNSAFNGCHALSSITIPDSVTSIGDGAFYDCHVLSSITIPESVTSISDNAFYDCYALSSITIPDSVTSIGDYTFYDCHALSSITIPDSVTSIGYTAFNSCYALSSITIPDSVTSIGDYAFNSCYALSSITIPDSVTSIGDYTFGDCYALSSITIPDSVTSVSEYAFGDCHALSSITIPDSVTSISNGAFNNCHALSSITIPDSITSISDNAFNNCYALSSITIPDSVASIGNSAFYYCHALSSITIPDSVTSIGDGAFYDCYALSSITFESLTPPELYGDLGLPYACIIRVPQGSLSAYTSAENYPDPSEYIYEEY